MTRLWKLPVVALLLMLLPARLPAEPPVLEVGLGREARKILDRLRQDGYHNVGVLKFLLVREGDRKWSDSVGTLNLLLARRLEVALVVKNSPTDPLGVIENASAVAEKIPGASHLSEGGLRKLFAAEYPLAWGKERVRPDALLVGEGMISRDLQKLALSISLFDAKQRKRTVLTDRLVVRLRPEHLAEIGESFHRGFLDRRDDDDKPPPTPQKRDEAIVEVAKQVRQEAKPHPAVDEKAPFALAVLYDGTVQPVEVRNGQAMIPEPKQDQKVEIRFTRRDRSDEVYGVVVKVNGENTRDRQRLADSQCRCWLSDPEDAGKPVSLTGFQVGEKEEIPFKVLSRAESKQKEVYYGSDVGMITMTVFAQRKGKQPAVPLNEEQKDERLIQRSELPGDRKEFDTFAQLQTELYASVGRGLIDAGDRRVESKIETRTFERDPTPVMTLTLRYYAMGSGSGSGAPWAD